jgi:hypothetical protein
MAGGVLGRWPDVEDDDVPGANPRQQLLAADRGPAGNGRRCDFAADQTSQMSGSMAWGVEQLG